MKIIVRTCGERTTDKCIELCRQQGEVEVINARPFGESIRQTYEKASTYSEKWVAVVDADVLLYPGTLKQATIELDQKNDNTFCLDGKTEDKILLRTRRAGIHIYRVSMLKGALKFLDYNHIKPESNIRRNMSVLGYPTHTGKIIFGKHDFEQYYSDLWRKAVCQTQKVAGMIKNQPTKWRQLAKTDKDYLVIYHAHIYGKRITDKITIDANNDFNAIENLIKLNIIEKEALK